MINIEDFVETLLYVLQLDGKDQRVRDALKTLMREVIAQEEYDNSRDRWED